MTITAVIAEYNPFHNGHAYHLQKAREETDADFLIVLMSGDFVQRGEPAVIGKFARARMALLAGADLVLELPPCFSCASAEYFAGGAVSLLNGLGCVDYLCFGSESGDASLLSAAADILAYEPPAYRAALKDALKTGVPYPKARQNALAYVLKDDAAGAVLSQPNDILGTEYLKALKKTGSRIRPAVIRRAGNGYHCTALEGAFPSATAIRKALKNADSLPLIRSAVPKEAYAFLDAALGQEFPVFFHDLSYALHHCLLSASSFEDYTAFFDVPEALARRIFRLRYEFTEPDAFVSLVCTRNFTEAQVRRALLHILLAIPADLPGLSQLRCFYAKILGLRRASQELLREIKTKGHLPLLSKPADAPAVLSRYYEAEETRKALQFLSFDRRCGDLYQAVLTEKFHKKAVSECAHGICIH